MNFKKQMQRAFAFAMIASQVTFLFVEDVQAQSADSEESRVAAERAKRRRYPGGRDEQDLTVQAVLPATSRYPEAPKPAPAPAASSEENESSND